MIECTVGIIEVSLETLEGFNIGFCFNQCYAIKPLFN